MKTQVLHLSTSHRADDNRIYFSEARSLAKKYRVAVSGLRCRQLDDPDVEIFQQKKKRLPFRIFDALRLFFTIRPDVVHLHDPEMILCFPLFRMLGAKVVYDAHEDYTCKFRDRGYVVSRIWNYSEKLMARFANLIVAADSHVVEKFNFHRQVILIGNFPPKDFAKKKNCTSSSNSGDLIVAYVGTIHKLRGLEVAVDAIELVRNNNVKLHIVGDCKYSDLLEKFESSTRTVYHGRIAWEKLPDFFDTVSIGIALYQPVPAFLYCPGENIVKLFEYAAFGIPSILPNFDKLSRFIETHGGAVCVDSTDANAVAETIERLIEDKGYYDKLSNEGIAMVRDNFNWEKQEQTLLDAYQRLLGTES